MSSSPLHAVVTTGKLLLLNLKTFPIFLFLENIWPLEYS